MDDTIDLSQEISPKVTQTLIGDLRQIIEEARTHVAVSVNSELTMMYWHIGERINRETLDNSRAKYGKQIVATVAQELQAEYGAKGFDEKNIRRMMQFAQIFPDLQIVAPLVRQLSWSHFLTVMPIKDELKREFYLTMAASERWSKRTLSSKIDGVAQYITELPPKNVLLHHVQKSLNAAKERLENK